MPDLSRLAPKMRSSPVPTLLGEDPDKRTWVRGVVSTMLYLVFSTAIILANKHIITETSFSCPITVSSLGSLFGWIVSIVAVNTGFTELKTHLTLHQWFLLVLPIGVCTALSLAFANIAYFYLTLSFIQMVKAFAPVVTFSILVLFGLDKFDMNVVLAIIVIVAGCFTASFGEMKNKSVQLGILCMLVCEVAEAFRSAGMQYLLAARSFSLFDGMYYFSPPRSSSSPVSCTSSSGTNSPSRTPRRRCGRTRSRLRRLRASDSSSTSPPSPSFRTRGRSPSRSSVNSKTSS